MKTLCSLLIVGGLVLSMAAPLYADTTAAATVATAATTVSSRPGIFAMLNTLGTTVQKYPYFTAMILLGASVGMLLQTTYGANVSKTAWKKMLDAFGIKKQAAPAAIVAEK